MNIILLGAPGAGKGTQAEFIASELNIPKISTGDMLRHAISTGSALGQRVKDLMDAGEFISDEIMQELVATRIKASDCAIGFLLDGYPRTIDQAKVLEQICKIDLVIELEVPQQSIIERLSGRRIHPSSGRVYHITANPPKVVNKDDVTGEDLIQRSDDIPSSIARRLDIYFDKTKPLSNWYKSLSNNGLMRYVLINGNQELQKVKQEILTVIRSV